MSSIARCGFTYDVLIRRKSDGALLDCLQGIKNRVPMEGLNDMATAYLKGGGAPTALYLGLWSGTHTTDGTETAANLSTLVSEVTAYAGSTRLLLELGSVTDGGCSNASTLARFDMQGSATVNGAFLSTVAAKSANYGKLISVVRFPNPRAVDASMYLEVLSGFQFISM